MINIDLSTLEVLMDEGDAQKLILALIEKKEEASRGCANHAYATLTLPAFSTTGGVDPKVGVSKITVSGRDA